MVIEILDNADTESSEYTGADGTHHHHHYAESEADSGSGEHHHHHRHHHHHGKRISKKRKALRIVLIVLASLLVLLAITALVLYLYMFGKLGHDNSFNHLTDAQLGIASTDNGLVRKGDTADESVGLIDVDDGSLGTEVPIGGISLKDIPQEALDLLDLNSKPVVSYLKSGADKIKNFVIYGLDSISSSDCIIIVSIDPANAKVRLISVARDTYAYISEYGSYSKLTYAYHWGGPELAIHTLNSNLSLNLRDYVAVDFEQMSEVVDLLGGVDIDLTQTEANYLWKASYGRYYFDAGVNNLDGTAALLYARMRQSSSTDSDVYRTGRQRAVLIALLKKAQTLSFADYPAFIREGMGMCTTSFTNSEVLSMLSEVVLNGYTVEQYALPNDLVDWWGGLIGTQYYSVYNKNYASDALYRIIYGDLYISGYSN